jgi:endonuclease-3
VKKELSNINNLLIQYFGLPVRKKENPDPLDILIGTILSQNTNDKNSFKAYNNLKSKIKSWEELISIRTFNLEKIIKVAGLGKQKARTIKSFLKNLQKKRDSISIDYIKKMNNEMAIEELTRFKGIGVKTASCVLLFSFGRNVCPVDTHIQRILNRLGLVKTKTPDKTYKAIVNFIPENSGYTLHTNLLRLGREICLPSNPKCSICPLEKLCEYEHKIFFDKFPKTENKFFLLDEI